MSKNIFLPNLSTKEAVITVATKLRQPKRTVDKSGEMKAPATYKILLIIVFLNRNEEY